MPGWIEHIAFVLAYFRASFRGISDHKASSIALIAANLLPILGVLYFDWDAFSIVALYWVENIVIGIINILKMIICDPKSLSFSIPFFALHYGFFCFICGVLVLTLFGHDSGIMSLSGDVREFSQLFSEHHLWWAIFILAASHLFSFVINFLGRGEFRQTTVSALTAELYSREIVLQIAILFGGWIANLLGNSISVLVFLVLGKTIADLNFHLRELDRNAAIGLPEKIVLDSPSD
jgi:hypothetical protein